MKKRYVHLTLVIIFGILLVGSLYYCIIPVQKVDGGVVKKTTKTFHLGDEIYNTSREYFFFHGFECDYTLQIGHHYSSGAYSGGMGEIYVRLQLGTIQKNTFYLKNRLFTIEDWDVFKGTITLSWEG